MIINLFPVGQQTLVFKHKFKNKKKIKFLVMFSKNAQKLSIYNYIESYIELTI